VKKILVALGGNAILKKGEKGTYNHLIKNIRDSYKQLLPLIKKNKIIITFGNGPQAGILAIQNELAKNKFSQMPLDVIGAESQGWIGYLLEKELINLLKQNKIKKEVVTILTQVLVDKKDKSFRNPTKFIGPFYKKNEISKLKKQGYKIKEDPRGGYRRVVPSPKPLKIIEENTIKKLIDKGTIVISCGGGGIPVYKNKDKLVGIEGVIDKDLASQCLASSLNFNELIIITDINKVAINYKKPNQKFLSKLKFKDSKKYLLEKEFPPGSMGPKVQASNNFLSKGGKKVIITNIKNIKKALESREGTIITK
jgi:carbamate kinase|tara:strand:+ start:326 stop:1255 length:930 start_codon:yes stop_codon:yes gene_type:complete